MLKIRLQRVGRKNDPSFRVIVTDSHSGPKSGKHVEIVGSHNPKLHKTELKGDRIKHWLSVGAQTSHTIHNLLISQNIIEGKKINVLPRKSPIVKDSSTTEEVEKEPQTEESPKKEEKSDKEEIPEVKTKESTEEKIEEEIKPAEQTEEIPATAKQSSQEIDKKEKK